MQLTEMPHTGYTIREAEAILNVSARYLYRLIREGKLDGYHDNVGQLRVSKEELYAYMKSREQAD